LCSVPMFFNFPLFFVTLITFLPMFYSHQLAPCYTFLANLGLLQGLGSIIPAIIIFILYPFLFLSKEKHIYLPTV